LNKQEQQQLINKNQKNVGPIKKERLSLDQHNNNNNNNNQAYNSQQPLNLSVEATQFNNHHNHHLSNNEENLESPSIQV
jgi:hypothetical protein